MPILDHCHEQVVRALLKEGWSVNAKAAYIDDDNPVYIDIEANKHINGGNRMTVQRLYAEVKCFPGHNNTQELYIALGQYILYRSLLAKYKLSAPLYLAVPKGAYETVFTSTVQRKVSDNQIKLIVVDLETETVLQWIE